MVTNAEIRSYLAGAVHALYLAMGRFPDDGNPSGVHVTLYVLLYGPGHHEVELSLSRPEIRTGDRMAQIVLFANEADMPMARADSIGYLLEVLDIAE